MNSDVDVGGAGDVDDDDARFVFLLVLLACKEVDEDRLRETRCGGRRILLS